MRGVEGACGYLRGAAAAVEAAWWSLRLEHRTLVPTWFLENLLGPCSLDAIRDGIRSTRVRHVVNNSAGFGGYNASVVLTAA